jgi:hypothetical protein
LIQASYSQHDIIGAEMAEKILKDLKFPNSIIEEAKYLIKNHMKAHDLAATKKVYKIKRFINMPNIDILEKLVSCDENSTKNSPIDDKYLFRNILADKRKEFPDPLPPPLITGDDLVIAGKKPGAIFKKVLNDTYNYQLNGCENKDKLLNYALGLFKTYSQENKKEI